MLHTIMAKLEVFDTRLCAIEAQGERHSFIHRNTVKVVKAVKAVKTAKVSSPARQDWANFKVMAKASGWTEEFYLVLEAWKKAHKLPKKLQGEDYFVAYNAAFRAKYVVA